MNPVSLIFRGLANWGLIQDQVNSWALEQGFPSYSEQPRSYRFSGWGLDLGKGIVCNVTLFSPSSEPIDAGRFPR